MTTATYPRNLSQSELRSHQAPFVNEPFLDFTDAPTKRAMQEALAAVKSSLGREYDLVIGGKRINPPARRRAPRRVGDGRGADCVRELVAHARG
jgi:hypothetical protein